jgi:transglutaminase-like putative cysteine protease
VAGGDGRDGGKQPALRAHHDDGRKDDARRDQKEQRDLPGAEQDHGHDDARRRVVPVTGRRRLGLVAAGATLLAAAPLSSIFDEWTWLIDCIIAVGLIAGAAMLARTLRAPLWAQALAMMATLTFVLTWIFPSGEEFLALLPTPDTFARFGKLVTAAGADSRSYGVPVPDTDGLLFLTVLGVGLVAIVVDLLTVGLRRPALAGLPMLAIYSVPVAVYVDSVPVMPFVVGAVGFLWLLVADNVDRVRRFGRRFTGDGRDVDIWEPSPLAAAGRRLAVLGVAAAVLLPLAVPGLTTGLLSRLTQVGSGDGPGLGAGGGGRVNLFANLSGELNQTKTVTMARVSTNEGDPFYLRFGVADVVTAQGFGSRSPSGRSVSRGLPEAPSAPGATYQRFRASVEVTDDFDMPMVPTYTPTVSTDNLDSSWFYDATMQLVYSNRSRAKKRNYQFEYVRGKFPPAALRGAPALGEGDPLRTQFTSVPPDQAVITQVNKLVDGERNDYDKVLAIYRFFSRENGFSYNVQTETGTAGSDIAAFLQNKVGFCQQYAAAMAWMVRQAGIPARVAFGFTRGARDGDSYVLTNRNLHAWTEVYFAGFGWIPFDATPAAAVVGSTRSEWAPDTDRVEPTATTSTATPFPGTESSAEATGPNAPERGDIDNPLAGTTGTTLTPGSSSGVLLLTGLAALVLALLAVPALRRVLLRRRRQGATEVKATNVSAPGPITPGTPGMVVTSVEMVSAREDAHAAWDELVDTMIDFKVLVDPAETPRHTAMRLVAESALAGPAAEAATLLGQAEERARYARQPMQGGGLTVALGQVRRSLASSASRRTRLGALLFPPSVMLRWRLSLADASGRWVGAFGRGRDAANRWSPRRLLAGRGAR